MPRAKNPTVSELQREQELYGNVDPDQFTRDQKVTAELEEAFGEGVRRMKAIIDGESEGNDAAAVSAFRAIADVYQAKKRLDRALAGPDPEYSDDVPETSDVAMAPRLKGL